MPETRGTKADGTPITDEMVEAMADEAERGYDVDELLRRRGGRPLSRRVQLRLDDDRYEQVVSAARDRPASETPG